MEGLKPCPFCGSEKAELITCIEDGRIVYGAWCSQCCASTGRRFANADEAVESWNRRAKRAWHDFADELPPAKKPVLCKGRNGAFYVGKPVTFVGGERTREVWVPRGGQYRKPEKWMEIDE